VEQKGNFSIAAEADYMIVRLEGAMSAEVVVQASVQLLSSDKYHSGKPVIWITSTADLSTVGFDMVKAAIKDIDQIYDGLPLGRIALVSERTINIWTIKLFKEMYEKEEVRVFKSFEEAKDWVLSG
jgi:hypothetical protein